MTQFTDLNLIQPLLSAVQAEGYTTPTPIQAKSILPLLEGRDLLGIAQTGTGKTAAFALPILQRLAEHKDRPAKGTCRALILSPTRELAAQILESFKTYGRNLKLSKTVVFGGVSINRQIDVVRGGVDILVATPGRLVDLIERRAITLAKVEIFVLDEVDQMLDLGFIHAIRKITGMLPKQRQNLFFSATMPREIAGLAANLLRDPVRVEITPVATTAEKVNQSVIFTEQKQKIEVLNALLKDNAMTRTLVFTRTKHGADKVVRGLEKGNYTAAAIHGNKSQNNRERALAGFKNGKILVLVATDIAARGIDVDSVSHVINYDLPHVPESYVHRIGRTARAGAGGEAIALCSGEEKGLLRDIERTIRMKVPVRKVEGVALPTAAEPAAPRPQAKPQPARHEPKRHHHEEKPNAARQRSDWNPMKGEKVVMYQKPQAETPQADRPHKPWFKKKEGANRFDAPRRGEGRGEGGRGFKPKSHGFKQGPRDDARVGDARPQGERPAASAERASHDRRPARPDNGFRRNDGFRGERHADPRFGERASRENGGDHARRDFKPRPEGVKAHERPRDGERKSFGFKGKPQGGFRGKPGGFGAPKRRPN